MELQTPRPWFDSRRVCSTFYGELPFQVRKNLSPRQPKGIKVTGSIRVWCSSSTYVLGTCSQGASPCILTMRALILRKKDRAWDVFSKWIRERDKRCVTCGALEGLQAGHFWHNVLDFDEMNINAQCARCNHYLSGNLAVYASYLISKYGQKKFQDLEARHYLAMKAEKRSVEDYDVIIEKYKIGK